MTINSTDTHILIEGLDLAGKSTVCRKLLDHFDPRPVLRRNALTEKNEVYEFADRLRKSRAFGGSVLGNLYLAALEVDLRQYVKSKGIVIQDSTIALRSIGHYAARGELEMAAAFRRLIEGNAFPNFDRAIVLTASIESRRERLEQRRKLAPEEIAEDDLMVVKAPEIFLRMEKILIKESVRRFGATVVDTSELTPAEVISAVASIINGEGQSTPPVCP